MAIRSAVSEVCLNLDGNLDLRSHKPSEVLHNFLGKPSGIPA